MMNISKKWIAFLGIPMLLCTSAMGFTGCKGHGLGHGKGFVTPERILKLVDWKINDFLDDISATSDQRAQINSIKERLVTEAIALHSSNKPNHQVMLDQWQSDAPDLTVINAIIDTTAQRKTAFAKTVADAIVELHAILTPEQRAAVTEHILSNHPQLGDATLN